MIKVRVTLTLHGTSSPLWSTTQRLSHISRWLCNIHTMKLLWAYNILYHLPVLLTALIMSRSQYRLAWWSTQARKTSGSTVLLMYPPTHCNTNPSYTMHYHACYRSLFLISHLPLQRLQDMYTVTTIWSRVGTTVTMMWGAFITSGQCFILYRLQHESLNYTSI